MAEGDLPGKDGGDERGEKMRYDKIKCDKIIRKFALKRTIFMIRHRFIQNGSTLCVCVRTCVCACVRACVRACVCVCVRV